MIPDAALHQFGNIRDDDSTAIVRWDYRWARNKSRDGTSGQDRLHNRAGKATAQAFVGVTSACRDQDWPTTRRDLLEGEMPPRNRSMESAWRWQAAAATERAVGLVQGGLVCWSIKRQPKHDCD